jgi:hypothetical protein
MKNAHQYASEILVLYADFIIINDATLLKQKLNEVFCSMIVNEIAELRKVRNISSDNAIIPVFKEQRKKFAAICKIVNAIKPDFLAVTDFDMAVEEIYPNIYEWYKSNIL